jgi:hypothetical protein
LRAAVGQDDALLRQPDDVSGQLCDLFGTERNARLQMGFLGEADGVVHQGTTKNRLTRLP